MIHFNPVEALTNLISIQSLSKEEEPARNLIESILSECKIDFTIDLNNIWAKNRHFDFSKYTIYTFCKNKLVELFKYYRINVGKNLGIKI